MIPASILGTKANTLAYLKDRLKKSVICDAVAFSVREWEENPSHCLAQIQNDFPDVLVIIRSSAPDEDSKVFSLAGFYASVLDVPAGDVAALTEAIRSVITSYQRAKVEDFSQFQILIQPMVKHVSMSGIVFTRDLNTGAPYYVLNYDDESGRTDTITSGTGATNKTLVIFRHGLASVRSERIKRLMEAITEIEAVTGSDALDIEFAETRESEIYIFQVRPLTTQPHWHQTAPEEVEKAVERIYQLVQSRQTPLAGVFGDRSILGQMPDWNPVEMIGAAPRPLAFSLYRYLITDSTWRIARAQMGYAEPPGAELMVSLEGQPYIDVRFSFHSYLPANLNPVLSSKLVNHWLELLAQKPELHDKVEFEVAITALTPDFEEKWKERMGDDFTCEEKEHFKQALLRLTDDMVTGKSVPAADLFQKVEILNLNRAKKMETSVKNPLLARNLLEDCISNGIIPFCQWARQAFIAQDFLRSFVRLGILSGEESDQFMRSVSTIASELITDSRQVQSGQMKWTDFLDRYGHLRPGTYDILSRRYDQRPSFIEDGKTKSAGCDESPKQEFEFSSAQVQVIEQKLNEYGFSFGFKTLHDFMIRSIQGREYSKFIFTHNISDALEVIASWGQERDLSREELSFLPITDILNAGDASETLKVKAARAAEHYPLTQMLRIPHLIIHPEDVMAGPLMRCRPNFITRKSVKAPKSVLTGRDEFSSELKGKIVVIESADPGFDWIFSQGISGLITKFGGANSHMSIRCAELGIPAAIGCGTQLFDRLAAAREIELDCAKGQVLPLWI
ncbi:MAG: pyruvate phosphate dikinase [Candidatus Omnitrophica bacterium]|nr:pyruvate phosphate dikinase [Candidatus Omnitrophota bacterium]